MSTNITPNHISAFEALTSGQYRNFALFSCFVNGARPRRFTARQAIAKQSAERGRCDATNG